MSSKWPWIQGAYKPESFAGTGHLRTKPRIVPKLFTPITQRGVTFKNRIVVSPLCMYSAKDGLFSDYQLVHLGTFARGGAGLVFCEATSVSANGRITPYCTGMWSDEHIPAAKRMVDFIHSFDTLAGIQLGHAGRKASTYPPYLSFHPHRGSICPEQEGGWKDVVGPSPIAFDKNTAQPHQLTKEEIKEYVGLFVEAVKRSDQAGFDVVEIHGAHGYLISTFLSPLTNKRTDEYGGSFENRTRFLMEIVAAVRGVWKKPLWVRVSSTDWGKGGWSAEDTVKLGVQLKNAGVDTLDCSSGGVLTDTAPYPGPGYQAAFASKVGAAGVSACAVGMISTATQAETLMINSPIEFVAIGRAFMRDPFWGLHAAKELGLDVHWSQQYEWAVNPKL